MLVYKVLRVLTPEELQACQPDLSAQEGYRTYHLGCGDTAQPGEPAQPAGV